METDINRLKVVLAEKKRTNKWLCEQLGVNPSTVSKWCTNSSQPDLQTLVKIARLLEVTVDELLNNKIELQNPYLQPIITQYFASNKSEIWP